MKFVHMAMTGFAMVGVINALVALQQASAQQPGGFPLVVGQEPQMALQGTPYPSLRQMTKFRSEEIQLERTVASLVREYAQAKEEGQREKVKANLSAALEKQFDLQQKRRSEEVARIEAELKKLRELMRKRTDARQTIVEKRLDQLLREAEGLGWTPPAPTGSYPARTQIGPSQER
jgi:hypothetical protein